MSQLPTTPEDLARAGEGEQTPLYLKMSRGYSALLTSNSTLHAFFLKGPHTFK